LFRKLKMQEIGETHMVPPEKEDSENDAEKSMNPRQVEKKPRESDVQSEVVQVQGKDS